MLDESQIDKLADDLIAQVDLPTCLATFEWDGQALARVGFQDTAEDYTEWFRTPNKTLSLLCRQQPGTLSLADRPLSADCVEKLASYARQQGNIGNSTAQNGLYAVIVDRLECRHL